MRRYRKRTRSQYLLPFVAVVVIGIIAVMAFQLWGMFFSIAKGDAIYYIADGRSKMLSFGTSDWENVYNGTKVKLGDSVKTLKNAKGVVTFYDGTVLRMDENTQITLLDITKKNDYQEILIYLNEGKVWVNKPKQNVIRKTDFIINTNFASYAITGTIFDLEKSVQEESLRMMKGQVQVDIVENTEGKTHSIESIPVGIGQQMVLNDAVMKEYYERKSPSVLGSIDPAFEQTDWYIWNNREDMNPTNFSKRTDASGQIILDKPVTPDISALTPATGDETADASIDRLPMPELLSPKTSNLVLTSDTQSISGKTVAGIKKVVLNQTLAGSDKVEKILINSFDPDKQSFTYDLSAVKGNMKEGLNLYEFIGYDENAKATWPLKMEIEYQKDGTATASTDELSAPEVSLVNGKDYEEGMTVEKDGFAITGTVSGVKEVWVNDFKLGKYKAGDKNWTYNVKASYGNLAPGVNTYKVYGVSESGEKTPITSFKINFKAPAASPAVVSAPASTPVAPTVATPAPAPVTPATPASFSATVVSPASKFVPAAESINTPR